MKAYLGEIRMFAGRRPPVGWRYCHGEELMIGTNEALFELIGARHGGDGRVTFALPDFRGKMVIGSGGGERESSGETPGEEPLETVPVDYIICVSGTPPRSAGGNKQKRVDGSGGGN